MLAKAQTGIAQSINCGVFQTERSIAGGAEQQAHVQARDLAVAFARRRFKLHPIGHGDAAALGKYQLPPADACTTMLSVECCTPGVFGLELVRDELIHYRSRRLYCTNSETMKYQERDTNGVWVTKSFYGTDLPVQLTSSTVSIVFYAHL